MIRIWTIAAYTFANLKDQKSNLDFYSLILHGFFLCMVYSEAFANMDPWCVSVDRSPPSPFWADFYAPLVVFSNCSNKNWDFQCCSPSRIFYNFSGVTPTFASHFYISLLQVFHFYISLLHAHNSDCPLLHVTHFYISLLHLTLPSSSCRSRSKPASFRRPRKPNGSCWTRALEFNWL